MKFENPEIDNSAKMLDASIQKERGLIKDLAVQNTQGWEQQAILDSLAEMVVLVDSNLNIVWPNLAACQSVHATREDLIGKPCQQFWGTGKEPCKDCVVTKAMQTRQIQQFEKTTPDGRTWLNRGHPVFDSQGKIVGAIKVCMEISETKHKEEELKRLRNFLSNIIDSMPSVLISVNDEGKVIEWNYEAEKLTGVAKQNAVGRQLVDMMPQLQPQLALVNESIQHHQTHAQSKFHWSHSGETHLVDITIYPLVTDGAQGAVIRLDDVTQRVKLEEMMIQSEKMLSVGGLAAGMAHEINNPLSGLMQNLQVIRNRLRGDSPKDHRAAMECGISPDSIRQYHEKREIFTMIEAAIESGKRAAQIVQNMLSFSRKGESTMALHDASVLLDKAVFLAQNDFNLKEKFDFRQIELVREYETGCPEILCEDSKIQQVFLNILKNGAEAMHQFASELRAAGKQPHLPRFVLRVHKEQNQVRIEIEDNGPGMPEQIRQRLFEPFFTTKPAGYGTGLGLSVSYFIITENHGGSMNVQSEPGHGTRFVILLPQQRNLI